MLFSFHEAAKGANNFRAGLCALIGVAPFFVGAPILADDLNPVAKVPIRDPAMTAAFAKASGGLDGFFVKWHNPPAGAQRFTVKIGLIDTSAPPGYAIVRPDSTPGFVEWFWVTDLRADGAGFSGRLGNEPDALRNVSFGQTIHFNREDIGDWMYWQDGKIIGNATACPALTHASAEERRAMKEQYGLACD